MQLIYFYIKLPFKHQSYCIINVWNCNKTEFILVIQIRGKNHCYWNKKANNNKSIDLSVQKLSLLLFHKPRQLYDGFRDILPSNMLLYSVWCFNKRLLETNFVFINESYCFVDIAIQIQKYVNSHKSGFYSASVIHILVVHSCYNIDL